LREPEWPAAVVKVLDSRPRLIAALNYREVSIRHMTPIQEWGE